MTDTRFERVTFVYDALACANRSKAASDEDAAAVRRRQREKSARRLCVNRGRGRAAAAPSASSGGATEQARGGRGEIFALGGRGGWH